MSPNHKSDVNLEAACLKREWTGHVCFLPDKSWANLCTQRISSNIGRRRGLPRIRWRDKLDAYRKICTEEAIDRTEWKNRMPFPLQWDSQWLYKKELLRLITLFLYRSNNYNIFGRILFIKRKRLSH